MRFRADAVRSIPDALKRPVVVNKFLDWITNRYTYSARFRIALADTSSLRIMEAQLLGALCEHTIIHSLCKSLHISVTERDHDSMGEH